MFDYLLTNVKISYEVAALFFDLVIVIFMHLTTSDPNRLTLRAFRFMAYSVLLVTLAEVLAPLDLLLPHTMGWGIVRDYIESSQFFFEHMVLFGFALYITSLTGFKPPRWLKNINSAVIIYAMFTVLTNPFLHLIFTFDEESERFVSGPFYIWGGYLPAVYFGLYSLVVFIIMFRNMMVRERYAIFFTIMMIFSESILQPTLQGKLKLVALFTSLGLFILYLSLETSDYQRLVSTQEKLLEAREEAASANRAKSVFIASMSHEIRTPMNAILGINDIILQNSREENILGYSRDMKTAGTSLLNIINDVLDVSKMEAGQFTIVEEEYYLDELLGKLSDEMAESIRDKKLEYQIRIKDDLPDDLYGDRDRLYQVLSNITDNSIKYTKRGIIIVDVTGEREDEYVHLNIAVTDTGIGIKKENMGDLFKNFKRIDMENNRSIEGTGLGLAISKQILTLMGGTIEVESTYGQGSVFTVHISQKVMSEMTVEEHRNSAGNSDAPVKRIKNASGKKILVVDDNEMNLRVAQAFLQPSHAEIKTLKDSTEALTELASTKYDLVFLDDLMPGLNGSAVLLRTRRMDNNPNAETPMVIMTVNGGKRERKDYERAGFCACINKPLSEDAVAEITNALI